MKYFLFLFLLLGCSSEIEQEQVIECKLYDLKPGLEFSAEKRPEVLTLGGNINGKYAITQCLGTVCVLKLDNKYIVLDFMWSSKELLVQMDGKKYVYNKMACHYSFIQKADH